MSTFIQGNLWESDANMKIVTTNGTIGYTDKGKPFLKITPGAAYQAANKYSGLSFILGSDIAYNHKRIGTFERHGLRYDKYLYGFSKFFVNPTKNGEWIGAFQTKIEWWERSRLSLIGYSIEALNSWIDGLEIPMTFAMNFPGIGLGGLTRREVEPILEDLNPRIQIYYE